MLSCHPVAVVPPLGSAAGPGSRWSANIHRIHTNICQLAGVRHIRFHDLRHTCATLLLEEGVELVTIKKLLGHAQLHITADIYAHVRPRLKRNAIEAMDRALQEQEDDDEADTGEDGAGMSDDEPPASEP
jgi:integrase